MVAFAQLGPGAAARGEDGIGLEMPGFLGAVRNPDFKPVFILEPDQYDPLGRVGDSDA